MLVISTTPCSTPARDWLSVPARQTLSEALDAIPLGPANCLSLPLTRSSGASLPTVVSPTRWLPICSVRRIERSTVSCRRKKLMDSTISLLTGGAIRAPSPLQAIGIAGGPGNNPGRMKRLGISPRLATEPTSKRANCPVCSDYKLQWGFSETSLIVLRYLPIIKR